MPQKPQSTQDRVWFFGVVTSILDVAYRMARDDRLPVWGSCLAQAQTEGRGQMRRTWHSPRGNLYAALRLPEEPPFSTDYAAPALGTLVAMALARMGLLIRIKWPNDILVPTDTGFAKLGGILCEERGGLLLAGIGMNLVNAPEEALLREEHEYPAIALTMVHAWHGPTQAGVFWKTLVLHVRTVYKEIVSRESLVTEGRGANDFARTWQPQLDRFLIERPTQPCGRTPDSPQPYSAPVACAVCTEG